MAKIISEKTRTHIYPTLNMGPRRFTADNSCYYSSGYYRGIYGLCEIHEDEKQFTLRYYIDGVEHIRAIGQPNATHMQIIRHACAFMREKWLQHLVHQQNIHTSNTR